MPKRLILYASSYNPYSIRQFDLRQGLQPSVVNLLAGSGWSAAASYPQICVTPNSDFMIAAGGGASATEGMSYWTDPFDLRTVKKLTSPVFSGVINCAAASQALYAVGGGSPFLYVLTREGSTLKTVATTGLGVVMGLDFSPDGSLLAVYHQTAPYLRIYKTADWTYTDVATAVQPGAPSAPAKGIRFNADGTKLVVATNFAPAIAVYNPLTMARLYSGSPIGNTAGQVIQSRVNSNEMFIALSATTNVAALKFNLDSYTFIYATGAPNVVCYSLALDEGARILYAMTDATGDFFQLRFNADTMAELPRDYGVLYQYCRFGNTACAIIQSEQHIISGTVRDKNNLPVARMVRAYRRSDGWLAAQTTSNATTGNYLINVYDAGPYDLQFLTLEGELLNDLFFANVEPEPVL